MAAPKKRTEPLPTKTAANSRYWELIQQLGMNHAEASRFLSTHYRTSVRWAQGEAQPSPELLMLLSVMVARKLSPDVVRMIAGFEPVQFVDRRFAENRDAPPPAPLFRKPRGAPTKAKAAAAKAAAPKRRSRAKLKAASK